MKVNLDKTNQQKDSVDLGLNYQDYLEYVRHKNFAEIESSND